MSINPLPLNPDLAEANAEDIALQIQHLFGDIDPDLGLIEVAWSDPRTGNVNRAKLFDLQSHDEIAREIARQNAVSNQNVYLSAGLRAMESPRTKRSTAASVTCITAIWADFDKEGSAEAALKTLNLWGMPPTLVVQTGAHPAFRAQFFWRLNRPTTNLAGAKRVMTTLATQLDGDKAVSDVGRVMRAAGSIAWPKKAGRIKEQTRILHDWAGERQSYDFDELVALVPTTKHPNNGPTPSATELSVSRFSQDERLRQSRTPGQWHCNIRDYVAHLVQGGATMETILKHAKVVRLDGYSIKETEDALRKMAEGALKKYAPKSAGLERDAKGKIRALIENVVKATADSEICGFELIYDRFRGEALIRQTGLSDWRPLADADLVQLRINLGEFGFSSVSPTMMRDAVTRVVKDNEMDSAVTWLLHRIPQWDGVARIDNLMATYFKTRDTAYTRALGVYTWTALVGRILEPGCKVDMVPVFVGQQGAGKSTGVMALVPNVDWAAEASLSDKDADLCRKLRGKLIIELGELRGLRTKEAESIKAWITTPIDRWTPKYVEFETSYPRRCLIIGTTNDDQFLADATGERRWLPVRIEGTVDVERIKADRDQLWAEALLRFKEGGIRWQGVETLARNEHESFREHDPWEDILAKWLYESSGLDGICPAQMYPLRSSYILQEGPLRLSNFGQRETRRLSNNMKALGFRSEQRSINGKTTRVWLYNG
jgi:hypothetical protein